LAHLVDDARTMKPFGVPAARAFVAAFLAVVMLLPLATAGFAASADDEPVLDEVLLEEVLEVISQRYVDKDALTSENLTLGAIRGIVEALGDDGHTLYLTEDELKVEQDALDGRVVGIGVVVDRRAGSPEVISVVDGSPADAAGLHAGDVITCVDGHDTSRLSIDDLADRVRGDIGTRVLVGVERAGTIERIEVSIQRENVEIEPVAWAFVPGSDVAVVRIVQFSTQAGRETRSAIESALESGATGIVLDVRGNPGGLVDEALVVVGSFINEGVAYQEQGREGPPRDVYVRADWALAPDLPLVVLVDYGTASSAEIVAGALRDNGRAPIVGAQTFGTGTVLNTFNLSDGSALRVGVLNWLTPSGDAVFRVGITPDDPVELPLGAVALEPGDLLSMTAVDFASSDDVPLRHAVRLLEAGPVS
jgi:carboxyl-terminal processing protease